MTHQSIKSLWFLFLKAWNDNGGYGLTLPYLTALIGHTRKETIRDRDYINDIIDDMIKNPVEGFIVNIRWCDDISSVVFEVQQSDSHSRITDRVLEAHSPVSKQVSLALHDRVISELKIEKNLDFALGHLINTAFSQIQAGKCSKIWTEEGLDYVPLQGDDYKWIEQVLSQAQPTS